MESFGAGKEKFTSNSLWLRNKDPQPSLLHAYVKKFGLEQIAFLIVRSGKERVLKELIQFYSPNPNQLNSDGNSILHFIIFMGYSDMFDQWLSLPGLNLNFENKQGETPFCIAVKLNREGMLIKLLQRGVTERI